MLIVLYPARVERGKIQVSPYSTGALSEADVLSWGGRSVSGLGIPARPDAVLSFNYGEDWRVPNRFFHFQRAQSNRAFADFLNGVRAYWQAKAA